MSSDKSTIQKRYSRIAGIYDIIEAPMEHFFTKWRKNLLQEVHGKTLEVGVGTGKNIPYYPAGIDLTGIDFSGKMIEIAKKKSGDHANIELIVMDAENMDFEDDHFDTIVTSCVFCSVPQPVEGLKEMKRVCKPGGRILMLEHVRSNKKMIGRIMDVINPVPLHIYGANINRRTYDNLLKAGFNPQHIDVENIWSDIVKIFRIKNT